MKTIVILLCFASFLFAVKTVPRSRQASDSETPARVEVVQSSKDKKDDDTRKDRFQDADSNGVNDQREDDFQKIKLLRTKHRPAKPGTSDNKTKEEKPKQSSKKTSQPTRTPERKSSDTKKTR
jgi:hypothetical protein